MTEEEKAARIAKLEALDAELGGNIQQRIDALRSLDPDAPDTLGKLEEGMEGLVDDMSAIYREMMEMGVKR